MKKLLATLVLCGGVLAAAQTPLNNMNMCFADGSKNPGPAAINSCNSSFSNTSSGLTWIPSNFPATSVWSTPPNGVMIVDTRFQNSFSLGEHRRPEFSHIYYDFHAGANAPWETNTGPFSGIQGIEIDGFADAGGYGGSRYAGVIPFLAASFRHGGARPIWGADISAVFSNNDATVNALEIDSGNNGTEDCPLATCIGINLIASGSKRSGVGMQVGKSGPESGFRRGLSVSSYDELGTLYQANGRRTADIYVIPPADDRALSFVLRNAANKANVLAIDDSGDLTTTGAVRGKNVPIVTSFTTTGEMTDNVMVPGMTVDGHCSLTATNAGAARGMASVYVADKTTDRITIAHSPVPGWTFDVMCTRN